MALEKITQKVCFIVLLIVVATSCIAQAVTLQNMARRTGAAYLVQRRSCYPLGGPCDSDNDCCPVADDGVCVDGICRSTDGNSAGCTPCCYHGLYDDRGDCANNPCYCCHGGLCNFGCRRRCSGGYCTRCRT